MNRFIFTGNLTKDCEVRYTPSGSAVCNFTVAVTDGYGDHKHTEFVECAIFGKRAEGKLPGFLTKGQKVLVEGRPKLNKREYKEKFYANISVFVDQVELIGGKREQSDDEPEYSSEPAGVGAAADPNQDIPFARMPSLF